MKKINIIYNKLNCNISQSFITNSLPTTIFRQMLESGKFLFNSCFYFLITFIEYSFSEVYERTPKIV